MEGKRVTVLGFVPADINRGFFNIFSFGDGPQQNRVMSASRLYVMSKLASHTVIASRMLHLSGAPDGARITPYL